MDFLYILETIRMPVLDDCILAITALGEETAFLTMALILFWCVDKKRGYLLMSVGFMGIMANQFMKLWFRVPRPWVLDPSFTIVEQAREAATGYSFPSGHTTNAVSAFGTLAVTAEKWWIRMLSVLLAAAVGFSRMYLGVHTPADVTAGAATALVLILVLYPIVIYGGEKGMKYLLSVMIVSAACLLAFVKMYPFPSDVDAENLASGLKNAYTMVGCLLGVSLVYWVDLKYLDFVTFGKWWAQMLKVVLGLALVIGVKEGLRAPLEALVGDVLLARGIRYFLLIIVAGVVWPMTFGWFSRLGRKVTRR